MTTSSRWPVVIPVLIVAGLGGWFAWQRWQPRQKPPPPPVAAAPTPAPAPVPAPAPASSASASAVRFPVDALAEAKEVLPAPPEPIPGVDNQVAEALFNLLGKDNTLTHLVLEGFSNRLVVTVDNLTQKHASTRFWPVERTQGRFSVAQPEGSAPISEANAARYEGFVRFIEGIDMKKAVRVYVRLYPRFQQAYEQLGYPNRYFNDRLVEVIDHLLATPKPAQPPTVRLTQVRGPFVSSRPWLHYEFEDPALEDRSAGQKILLRMGPAHAQRIKVKLIELRVLLTRGAVR